MSVAAPATAPRRIGEVLMEMRHITLRFGGVTAIKDISFDIREGEIRAIIGPNGAGKSSMLNVINGFYHPQEGEIWFRGAKRGPMRPHAIARQGIARTFQNIALFKGMSTLDNIMTGRFTHMHRGHLLAGGLDRAGRARGDREPRGGGADHRLPADPGDPQDAGRGGCPTGCRSGSSSAARWRPSRSSCLLDEPMAGMNVEEKEDMCRFILDVNDEFGTTIALIEHDMGVVMDISDRVVVLDYGRKIGDGTPDEVRANPDVIDAYLGVGHD